MITTDRCIVNGSLENNSYIMEMIMPDKKENVMARLHDVIRGMKTKGIAFEMIF